MRLESIDIKNFRQYRNLSYSFDRLEGKTDLHIIHGRNGVGKTNLLNAITWCLYNRELHLRDEDTAIETINSKIVNEIRRKGGGQSEVSVKINFSDGIVSLKFERKASYNITEEDAVRYSEEFVVETNESGEWKKIDSKNNDEYIQELIDKYVPEDINKYIFFDGEQMENFFSNEQRKKIKDGICKLTQADYLQDAFNEITRYIKHEIEPSLKTSGDTDVEALTNQKVDAEKNLSDSNMRIADYQAQLKLCDDEIANTTNIIGGHENLKAKTDRLAELESAYTKLEKNKEENYMKMQKFAREQYFAHVIYPSLKSFYDYIRRQDELGNLPPRIDKVWLHNMLINHHCSICGRDTDAHAEMIIKQLEHSLGIASGTSAELNRAMGAISQYLESFKNYERDRDILISESKRIKGELDKNEKEQANINRFLHTIQDSEAITKAIEDRDKYQELKVQIASNMAREEVDNNELEKHYNEIEDKLKKALARNRSLRSLYAKKLLCENSKKIIQKIRTEVLEECRIEIEKTTYDYFNRLIWKDDAFSDVKIDEDYTFRLLDMYGRQTLGSCSAAEGALLALSFTLALQEVSKHDSLLFIDTPLGRVDDENRSNFIDTLLDIAKDKQVILTFTPTEYSDNVKKAIAGKYSTLTEINMDEGVTTSKKI